MKYLLADAIVYDNEDGSLTLQSADAESQTLTCTAQTILNLLIAHHGMVVERVVFLQQVWDDRGLRGSSNSLNQYISILRKMLAGMVPDHLFIVTVPKVGFMLSADISVVPLNAPVSAPAPVSSKRALPKRRNWLYGIVTATVAILGAVALIWNAQRQQIEPHLLTAQFDFLRPYSGSRALWRRRPPGPVAVFPVPQQGQHLPDAVLLRVVESETEEKTFLRHRTQCVADPGDLAVDTPKHAPFDDLSGQPDLQR